jgi:hypothetical protein
MPQRPPLVAFLKSTMRGPRYLAAGRENFAPAVVEFAEHAGDHAAHFIRRRAGLGGLLVLRSV